LDEMVNIMETNLNLIN